MVLKRILVTTLSALGLGALAAGTASGQTAGDGNIPAPDIFDDQITCSMLLPRVGGMNAINTPSRVASGMEKSALDELIGMGTGEITDDVGLGYTIPAMGSNCGGPTGVTFGAMDVDTDVIGMLDSGDVVGAGSIPVDVAEGYSALLPLFQAVYGNPGVATSRGTSSELAAAQKDLREAIDNGLPAATITSLQREVTRAQETHNMALARFNSAAGGPIYQAGVAEWMAKAAVTKSIDGYNKQVKNTNDALKALDGLNYDSYVPLGNSDLITAVFKMDDTGMDAIHTDALEAYNGDLLTDDPQFAEVADNGVTMSDESNFDQTGKLIVPMQYYENGSPSADQANPSDDAVLRPVTVSDQIGDGGSPGDGIRYVVERTNAAAAALKKLRDENVVTSVQSVYNDAYARAQAEADYYNEVWNRMLADNTDLRTLEQKGDDNRDGTISAAEQEAINNGSNTTYIADPITIAGRAATYRTESNKRETAEQGLRAAVVAREQATDAVVAAFNSPQSFYEQLVARRQALKATADKAVADATPVGGVVPEGLTDAQDDAAKALANAEKARDELLALFEDEDDPTVALINELVKNNGDDGQALVDAISATYETAAGAADAAREVVNELTGDDGAVSANTADIKTNSDAIDTLDGEVFDADGNSRIDANETRSMANETRSMENRTLIDTNMENITANATKIMENATNIMENTGHIMENATNITANTGMIETNAADIVTNAGNIMTNAGNISMNSASIEANMASIGTNADAIAANMNSIGSNSSAISDNRNMIGELSEDLETVRAGVAASMALAGMPAINGRGISIGVGSFDGESAFAVGFQIQGEQASFKVGVTSASGATGASAGVGFQF